MFYLFLLRTSIRSSITLKGAFLIQTIMMMINNFVFFILWWIFFSQFREIDGWTLRDMVALLAVGTAAHGILIVCFGGLRRLSRTILDGDLDPLMTKSKNLLLHIALSRSVAKGWGDFITFFIYLFIGNLWDSLPLLLLCSILGSLVFASVAVIAHSSAFWLGQIDSVARKWCDSLFLFALYPTHIYSGLLQVVMFTLIPAGLITYIPVELIRNFSITNLAILLGGVVCFCCLAVWVFHKGLKRYESGSRFL